MSSQPLIMKNIALKIYFICLLTFTWVFFTKQVTIRVCTLPLPLHKRTEHSTNLDDSLLEVILETLVLPGPEIVLARDDRQHDVGVFKAPEVGHELRQCRQRRVGVHAYVMLLGLRERHDKQYLQC